MKQQIAGFKGGRIYRHPDRINTKRLSLCPACHCMTWTTMDDNGNRYCGKCKERKPR